ncbi:MAG TPA: efflux RND transporter permease subunit [Gemmatimonadaceae bacterium]|nr:efflux RND transporter permease subunit [Gemmatimonadaceae bacterium]
MIERIIRSALDSGTLVLFCLLIALGGGVFAYRQLSTDVFPDLTVPVFNVITQNASMAPEELELSVTLPLESSLNGLPGVRRLRSVTQQGVSQVTVEFESDIDYWRARQLVTERLSQVLPQLPEGTRPPLLSSLTNRLNEVYEYLVEGDIDPMQLRDLAEFDLRHRILAVPGVASVERLGGALRQYQVQLDPNRMRALGISLDEVLDAVRASNENAPGGVVSTGETEFSVRSLGRITSVEDLKRSVITARHGTPVTIAEVAAVVEGGAIRRGLARAGGREVVSSRVIKQVGTDTVQVTRAIRAALEEAQKALPAGVQVRTVYDQSELIEHALSSVQRAILVGAVLVVIVLFVLLGDARSALIVTITLPLSVVLAGIVMRWFGAGINTMTLGGLAISVGILVDAAIIMTENIHHRLTTGTGSRRERVLQGAIEVGRPIAFATAIIMAVFLPLFLMTGIEGRLYRPLALTVVSAMAASLVLSLTLVPMLCAWWLKSTDEGVQESDVAVIRAVKRVYIPSLGWAFRHAWLVRGFSLAITIPAFLGLLYVGTEFMPELDEGALLIQTVLPGEASLEQVDKANLQAQEVIAGVEGVASVSRRTGRSEETEDPMPHVLSDVLVQLKPPNERGPTDAVADEIREALEDVPGLAALFTTPLGMRIDEGLGGTPAELSIRVFGPDLTELGRIAQQIGAIAAQVEGVTDLRVEQASGVPQLQVRIDRVAAARLGLTAGEIAEGVRVSLGGEVVSEFWQGQRNYGIQVRQAEPFRTDLAQIAALPLMSASGQLITLGQVATIDQRSGPSIIRRENVVRRVAVEASVEDRDLGSTVRELQERLAAQVQLPSNYYINFGGQFEQQERAFEALALAIALAVGLVFVLLLMALGSVAEVSVILLTLPDAFVGGILALILTGETLNVSSAVGFIGLFGIAVQNGLVLIAQTRALMQEGLTFDDALRQASIGRVRPKLMTASCAMLGLLPLVLLPGQGGELERPLAIVMIGGLVTSTLFTLLALPTFYSLVHGLQERWRRQPAA